MVNSLEALGDSKAVRAVATANGANAMSLVVPCHRVIGGDGALTGYAGGLPVEKIAGSQESGAAEQLKLL